MDNIKILNNHDGSCSLCVVLKSNDGFSMVCSVQISGAFMIPQLSTPYKVSNDRIIDITLLDKVSDKIKKDYEYTQNQLKSQLMSTKPSDYNDDVERDKFDLKKRIQKIAKNISEANIEIESDYECTGFENALKEICQLKKKLYEFKNEYVSEARKINGRIKYNIRELDAKYKRQLLSLDLEVFDSLFK